MLVGPVQTKEILMDWTKLLALGRLCDPNYIQSKHRPVYTQDIDRILIPDDNYRATWVSFE
jgi:hypothetical protein